MEQIKIRDICSLIGRGVTPLYDDAGILILNQKCIRDNKVSFEKAQFTSDQKRYSSEKFIQKNDILINSTGAGTLGRVALYDSEDVALCDSHVTIVRVNPMQNSDLYASPKYVGYYLHLNETVIESLGKGATNQLELSSKDIGKINIDLPDRITQEQVVSTLSAYDNLIEINNKRIKVLEQMAENLYKEWFVRFRFPGHETAEFENGIPKGWEYSTIESVSSILQRGISPEYDDDGELIVISQKCIRQNIMDITEARKHSKAFKAELNLADGDTVICSTGTGTLGRVGQVYGNYQNTTFDSHVTLVRANALIGKHFLYWSLKELQPWFMNMGIGSTNQQELYRGTIKNAKFLLPTHALIEKFELYIESIHKNIILLGKMQTNSIRQRDLLLPRLMSGKLGM